MRGAIRQVFGEPTERWPKKIEDRFSECGLAIDYRTVYARMSSETHADAEETVRFLLGKLSGDPKILEQMALETTSFSRYLMYFAVLFFLQASLAYACSYKLSETQEFLKKGIAETYGEILNTIPTMGAGI